MNRQAATGCMAMGTLLVSRCAPINSHGWAVCGLTVRGLTVRGLAGRGLAGRGLTSLELSGLELAGCGLYIGGLGAHWSGGWWFGLRIQYEVLGCDRFSHWHKDQRSFLVRLEDPRGFRRFHLRR